MDPVDRLVSRPPAAALRSARRANGPAATCTKPVTVRGTIGQLRGELQHYAYRDIADHLETIDRYTTYAARQMHEAGAAPACCRSPATRRWRFLRNYIARGGIRDGVPGFIISSMNAYYVFLKFAKLWSYSDTDAELEVRRTQPEDHDAQLELVIS